MSYVVFDLETQNLAAEVGGWSNIEALRLAVACTWDERGGYQLWWEGQAGDLLTELGRADLIVGYNVSMFDYKVLSLYGSVLEFEAKTFDLLDEIFQQVHHRVSLNAVAQLNLGEAKAHESGADAVKLWRTGKLEELAAYCQRDVELTRRLYEMWEAQGLLWISETEYVVWPGPRRLGREEEEELIR